MPGSELTAIQAIQAILAPAIGISAVGLLLLSLSNKYSTIINRIRLLNDERRKFSRQMSERGTLTYLDNIRFMNINKQREELLLRSRFVRNAILSMLIAIGLFVLTSVLIALNLFISNDILRVTPLIIFIVGMISVLVGIAYFGMEVLRSFNIILLEIKGDE